ncbi:class I adenylate-forming enzyme family protein [Congregibacter litoralis]|uniref:Acyl-CoA synthetase (AMP-forming)/AMP-acid ligase II n=1 Tax=Congregibacter litoralis KT71 TaxID=314285 RepID=A4ABZ2_9GAMM|nr:class I adenylate-forming enzyme family protein [Congregibacter litoralis]EAQ96442.1 Acyl-CoA synthetase (AMP-forming)/AMP-acid ligase II [Congregibacter litoralis KT71]
MSDSLSRATPRRFKVPDNRLHRTKHYLDAGLWGTQTLHGLLANNARSHPDREAVVDQPDKASLMGVSPRRLTLRQLDEASSACALALQARGITPGDAVILQLPNTSELIVLYYALNKLGAVISPIAVQYAAHEISHFAAELHPAAFITVGELRGADLAAQAREVLSDTPVIDVLADLDVFAGVGGSSESTPEWANDPNAILTIAWTSGTTGTPKGVPRSHNMWIAQGRITAHAAEYRDGERLLSPFPMINMAALGGFLFPSALCNCTLVLHHPLDIPLYLQQLQEESINFTLAPPPLLNRLAQQAEMWNQFDFSALRVIGSGSVPLSPAMIEVFESDFGKPIINFYGSNEGIGLIATPANSPSPADRAQLFPRLGAPGMSFESFAPDAMLTRIDDVETGATVTEAGVPGELVVDGPGVFDGYLNHDGDGVFTADGFFRSGDLVEICPDKPSHYRIVGRCKDIINRGGTKLSPSEIDSLLESMPGLAEAAVCAYADDDLGERICACLVILEDSEAPTLDALRDFLRDKGLARFKLPERLEVFSSLPRNPLGKVLRNALREQVEKR